MTKPPAPLSFRGLSNLNVDVQDSPRNLDQPFRLGFLAFALRRLEMTNVSWRLDMTKRVGVPLLAMGK